MGFLSTLENPKSCSCTTGQLLPTDDYTEPKNGIDEIMITLLLFLKEESIATVSSGINTAKASVRIEQSTGFKLKITTNILEEKNLCT